MATVLSLLAKLNLDKTGFDQGLKSAQMGASKFGASIGRAFSIAAVTAFAKKVVDAGSEIKDMSDRLGLSVEDVQRFSLAAHLGGTDIDTFAGAIERMRKAVAQGKGLEGFGISREQLLSGDVQGTMQALADDIEKLGLNSERTKELFDVFGKGIGKLIPALFELRAASKEPLFTEQEVKQLDEVGDALTRLWSKTKIFGFRAFKILTATVGDILQPKAQEPIAKRPRIQEEDLVALEEQQKREQHMREQDEALRLERERIQKESEAWQAQQDRALAEEQRQKMLNAGAMMSFGRGGPPGMFIGGATSAPQRSNELLQKIHDALVKRGIIVRETVQ